MIRLNSYHFVFSFILLAIIVYGGLFYFTSHRFENWAEFGERVVVADSDAKEYVLLGQNIFNEQRFTRNLAVANEPEVFRTPGYPFLAGLWLQVSTSPASLIFLNFIFVLGTGLVIYLLGQSLGSKWVGAAASLFYLLDPTTIFNSLFALSDLAFVFLFLLAVYLLWFKNTVSLTSTFFNSLLLATSILIRPIAIFAAPVVIIGYLILQRDFWRGRLLPIAALFLVSFSIILGPWLWRNGELTGHYSLSSLTGYNLLFYNAAQFKAQSTGQDLQVVQDEFRSQFAITKPYDLSGFRFGDEYQALARGVILAEPFSYAQFHLLKTVPVFLGSGLDNYGWVLDRSTPPDINISSLVTEGEFGQALKALFVDPLVLLERLIWLTLILLAGLSVFVNKNKRLIIAGIFLLIAYFAVAVGPVAMPRYRLPISPFIFLLAGLSVQYLFTKLLTYPRLRLFLSEFGRYFLASLVGLAVDAGLLIFLTEVIGLHYLVSATISFLAGLGVVYWLSIKWVFSQRVWRDFKSEFLIFGLIGIVGLILNNTILWLLTDKLGLYYLLSKVVAVGLVFNWNFLARKLSLFHQRVKSSHVGN